MYKGMIFVTANWDNKRLCFRLHFVRLILLLGSFPCVTHEC